MNKIAVIPARYAATRFPAKLMQKLGDKTVIATTYAATKASGLFDEVLVATDSEIIFNEIKSLGGQAVMSRRSHESGTDRIAEAIEGIDADVFINVQGDTPFVKRQPLEQLLKCFDDNNVQVASLMQVLHDEKQIADPNYVKLCIDKKNNALFFSRSIIPYPRDKSLRPVYYEHIGVYAFRKEALLQFSNWPVSPLESVEKIECLRFLENGVPIRMAVTDYMGVEIDTPEDLEKAAGLLGK